MPQAWLNPVNIPTAEQLRCKATGKPLDFLLQVDFTYADFVFRWIAATTALSMPVFSAKLQLCALRMQVYATPPAFDQDPAAFHRAIFLFISPQVGLLHAGRTGECRNRSQQVLPCNCCAGSPAGQAGGSASLPEPAGAHQCLLQL